MSRSIDSLTQVELYSDAGGRLVCWVETRYAILGKKVMDDLGAVWEVRERYVTWPKERLDRQRQTYLKIQEVIH